MRITRKVEFDAGHRIPDHESLCRNAHGHRYTLECTIEGEVQAYTGKPTSGMVMDFGTLKQIMNEEVANQWDHAFLVHKHDFKMIDALEHLGPAHKTVKLNHIPTVENLVIIAALLVAAKMPASINSLSARLYETPNCWADYQVKRMADSIIWHDANI